jgi:membrane peptidoglycan carboxypeptidase
VPHANPGGSGSGQQRIPASRYRPLPAGRDDLGRLRARPPTRSVIRAADGSVLAVLHGDQDRVVVPLSAIPTTVRDAVLAAEDARFYQQARWILAASRGRSPST